ncbi:diacylglycerol kinase family protein [Paenibacillus sp. 5J-6]|jgi:diacylglycerol kinase|uniref:Diacylglycerol kinase family protein n=1 Tax=Paenibacillus silvestris TaxID=2606219 RepID=A0A6L8UXV1_9BACL|nr:diacylglycerol kinase family protein [Paenibacillus silvestris]MZQ81890.1 diacylglycerol kinase family protein [Paenibacillus silvestris]
MTNGFRKWRRSFRYAYEGIKYALDTQRNMKFHFCVAFLVLLAALFARLPKTDILFILLAVTLMIVTELINTAVEKTVDLAMPDRHPLAKIAKDVAAASVLVSAGFAVIVGMIVFYEPIDQLLRESRTQDTQISAGTIWVLISLVILTVIVIETRFSDKGKLVRPSLLTAIAFSISTVIVIFVTQTIVALLAYTLAALIFIMLYDKKTRPFPALFLGALIGTVVTILALSCLNML